MIDVRFFVTAVLTQRETGGNLAEVLDNLGTVTRDRFRIEQRGHAVIESAVEDLRDAWTNSLEQCLGIRK